MQKDLLLNKEKICKLQNNEFIELKNTELNLLGVIDTVENWGLILYKDLSLLFTSVT